MCQGTDILIGSGFVFSFLHIKHIDDIQCSKSIISDVSIIIAVV